MGYERDAVEVARETLILGGAFGIGVTTQDVLRLATIAVQLTEENCEHAWHQGFQAAAASASCGECPLSLAHWRSLWILGSYTGSRLYAGK